MKKSTEERTVALIYGGKSCEHDISVITACLAKGYFNGRLLSIYIDKQNRAFLVGNNWTPYAHLHNKLSVRVVFLTGEGAIGVIKRKRLVKIPIDVAVNCCHGLNGEDGCIAALCQMCEIPLVGSDVASGAVAMDKILTKQVLSYCGFPVIKGVGISNKDNPEILSELSYPLIVKPALLGSSIGVSVVHSPEQLRQALNDAFKYCSRALVEEALSDFVELNCAAMRMNGEVITSEVDSPVTVNELLTFGDKYLQSGTSKKAVPSVANTLKEDVVRLTSEIYNRLGFGGVIRVDFLYDNKTGRLYVNEINTTPGSLAFGLWEGRFSRTQYGEALVDEAIADYRDMQSYTYTFESSVLNGVGGIKKK